MTSISVVTSCSAKGWAEYGREFVETFLRNWPADVDLHLVSEDDIFRGAVPVEMQTVLFWSLWPSSRMAETFAYRHLNNARAHGTVRINGDRGWSQKKTQRGYNFRYDAYRFAKKVFAIEVVASRVGRGRLFWVDADVRTFNTVPRDLLEKVLPNDYALSCLDRGSSYHSECGFVGYNLDHDLTLPFIREFAALYASDQVFGLGEWHDSWVFDWLRRKTNVPTFAIPHNSRHHPFVNSDLGHCMDHLKGARKDKGRTPTEEVLSSKKRALPYWRGMVT